MQWLYIDWVVCLNKAVMITSRWFTFSLETANYWSSDFCCSTSVRESALSSPSSSSSSIISERKEVSTFETTKHSQRTFTVHFWMCPKTVLHRFKLFYAVYTLRFFFRVNETRKCLAELRTTGSVSHPSQTRTIPVNFARYRIKSPTPTLCIWLFVCFFLLFFQ